MFPNTGTVDRIIVEDRIVITRMRRYSMILLWGSALVFAPTCVSAQDDWTQGVRTSAYAISATNADTIVRQARESRISGIEIDNDITGRYRSFLDPHEELAAIKALAGKAHAAGNHAFVYIAGWECITANADKSEHTFFKDHPDWVQRDINGKPAVFGGGTAFWVRGGDEDVWISPYAEPWRRMYMERVRQIVATGIDGIYVDVPYWMTHYDGWENTWASFDDYTIAEFTKETGIDAKKEVKLGDFSDPAFVQWVKFRIKTVSEFFEDIRRSMKSVNPACKLIPEIFPGIDESVAVVGSDVYQLYAIADVITHEYHEGNVYAAEREPFDWFNFIAGIRTFRAFAEGRPTWLLSYSWYEQKAVSPSEAMKSLFASEAFSGANVWDAKGYVMSHSNDMATRKEVYTWIEANEENLYAARTNDLNEVGIYFSPLSRDLFPKDYIDSYRGMVLLLMNTHVNWQVVTPRNLAAFDGKILILDNVQCISDEEVRILKSLSRKGIRFLMAANNGAFDENRTRRSPNASEEIRSDGVVYLKNDPGAEYYDILSHNVNSWFHDRDADTGKIEKCRSIIVDALTRMSPHAPAIQVEAPFEVTSTIANGEGAIYVNLINVRQLSLTCGSAQSDDSVRVVYAKSQASDRAQITPFLGEACDVKASLKDDAYTIVVPRFNRGAVVCIKKH